LPLKSKTCHFKTDYSIRGLILPGKTLDNADGRLEPFRPSFWQAEKPLCQGSCKAENANQQDESCRLVFAFLSSPMLPNHQCRPSHDENEIKIPETHFLLSPTQISKHPMSHQKQIPDNKNKTTKRLLKRLCLHMQHLC